NGRRARVTFSNSHGTAPMTIGSAHIAVRSKGSEIVAGSDRELTFGGQKSAFIAQGGLLTSDPVALDVPDLVVSAYVPAEVTSLTMHATGLHTTYVADGNQTSASSLADAKTSNSWYFLSAVEVTAPNSSAAIVAFGDSITDGARSTVDTDSSWP